jgi:AcrR family transcriptional regulator
MVPGILHCHGQGSMRRDGRCPTIPGRLMVNVRKNVLLTKPSSPMDRRVQRTRNALQEALLKLMRERGYNAVTVTDVCAAANIGRSTFYANYKDIDELKHRGFDNHLRQELQQHLKLGAVHGSAAQSFAFVEPLLHHAHGQLDLYRVLVSKGGAAKTLEILRKSVSLHINSELQKSPVGLGPLPREAIVQILTGAFMSLLTWWLDAGATLPVSELGAAFRRLAEQEFPARQRQSPSR